jgi:hypothetical protein
VPNEVRAQQLLGDLLTRRLAPVLRAERLRREGRRTWWQGEADAGWVLLDVQGSKFNTREQVELTVNTTVWPPGTWEVRGLVLGEAIEGRPFAAANAPFYARPQEVRPDRWQVDRWWQLGREADVSALGDELVGFVRDDALPWARARLDPAIAVEHLLDRPDATWRLVFSIAVLRRAGADVERVRDLVERLTAVWARDPRPIRLRPHLIAWRTDLGLPEVHLPEVWSPSMQPHLVERFGSPEAARAAGIGIHVYHWDGRSWEDRPDPATLPSATPTRPPARTRRRGGWWR